MNGLTGLLHTHEGTAAVGGDQDTTSLDVLASRVAGNSALLLLPVGRIL
jgi:hypothetical protein